MITEMTFEYASDGWHGKTDKRPLMRIESLTCLHQSSAGNLKQVLLVLAAMQEPAGKRFGQPQMGADNLINDLLTPGRTCGLSLEKKVVSAFGKFFP